MTSKHSESLRARIRRLIIGHNQPIDAREELGDVLVIVFPLGIALRAAGHALGAALSPAAARDEDHVTGARFAVTPGFLLRGEVSWWGQQQGRIVAMLFGLLYARIYQLDILAVFESGGLGAVVAVLAAVNLAYPILDPLLVVFDYRGGDGQ